jgi:hypothetical protein
VTGPSLNISLFPLPFLCPTRASDELFPMHLHSPILPCWCEMTGRVRLGVTTLTYGVRDPGQRVLQARPTVR